MLARVAVGQRLEELADVVAVDVGLVVGGVGGGQSVDPGGGQVRQRFHGRDLGGAGGFVDPFVGAAFGMHARPADDVAVVGLDDLDAAGERRHQLDAGGDAVEADAGDPVAA